MLEIWISFTQLSFLVITGLLWVAAQLLALLIDLAVIYGILWLIRAIYRMTAGSSRKTRLTT